MEERCIHQPISSLVSAILAPLLLVVSLMSDTGVARIEPCGRKIGVVQFDAILVLSPSFEPGQTVIFARYWVSPQWYRVGVVWSEPHGKGAYPVRPATLTLAGGESGFRLAHDLDATVNRIWAKPPGQQGPFSLGGGHNAIADLRYVERETLERRVLAADLKALDDPNRQGMQALSVPLTAVQGVPRRQGAALSVRAQGPRIDTVEVLDAQQRVLRTFRYDYGTDGKTPCLRRQTVFVPEGSITLDLGSRGMTVKQDDKTSQIRHLQAPYPEGGRTCTVDYKSIVVGAQTIPLPRSVTVRGGPDQQVLRSVQLMNFKRVDIDPAGAWRAARQFATLTAQQRRFQDLLLGRTEGDLGPVLAEDRRTARELIVHFEKAAGDPLASVGEQVKALSILMDLDQLVDDGDALVGHYRRYLDLLCSNGLPQMVLWGGYETMETVMASGRVPAAERLLRIWSDVGAKANDAEVTLSFAVQELKSGHLWTTERLLARLLERDALSPDAHFAAQAMRCEALDGLVLLLGSGLVRSNRVQAQSAWVRSCTTARDLGRQRAEACVAALELFGQLREPTEAQRALKAKVDLFKARRDASFIPANPSR